MQKFGKECILPLYSTSVADDDEDVDADVDLLLLLFLLVLLFFFLLLLLLQVFLFRFLSLFFVVAVDEVTAVDTPAAVVASVASYPSQSLAI